MADQEFTDQFVERFIEETSGHLVALDDCLMEMEISRLSSPELISRMVGIVHSLKGNAMMMDFPGICETARTLEDILSRCRQLGEGLGEVNVQRMRRVLEMLAQWLERTEQLALMAPDEITALCDEIDRTIPPVPLPSGEIDWDTVLPASAPLRGETRGGMHLIALRAQLQPASLPRVQDALIAIEQGVMRGIVAIDLAGFHTLTSMLIGALVTMHRCLIARGQRLVLCTPSEEVLRLLQVTGINQLIRIYPDFDTALLNERI